jgi:hypothetical protein
MQLKNMQEPQFGNGKYTKLNQTNLKTTKHMIKQKLKNRSWQLTSITNPKTTKNGVELKIIKKNILFKRKMKLTKMGIKKNTKLNETTVKKRVYWNYDFLACSRERAWPKWNRS